MFCFLCSNSSWRFGSSPLFHEGYHVTSNNFGPARRYLWIYLKWKISAPFYGISCKTQFILWIVCPLFEYCFIQGDVSRISKYGSCNGLEWIQIYIKVFLYFTGYFLWVAIALPSFQVTFLHYYRPNSSSYYNVLLITTLLSWSILK